MVYDPSKFLDPTLSINLARLRATMFKKKQQQYYNRQHITDNGI